VVGEDVADLVRDDGAELVVVEEYEQL